MRDAAMDGSCTNLRKRKMIAKVWQEDYLSATHHTRLLPSARMAINVALGNRRSTSRPGIWNGESSIFCLNLNYCYYYYYYYYYEFQNDSFNSAT